MRECSKAVQRRLNQANFISRYFIGDGIDIGGKPDPLIAYRELFPGMRNVITWDLEDGDAQYLESIEDEKLNFVHSSHCLEHLIDPYCGLKNWFRVLKHGGHMVITVPDEDLYEQGVFPSRFNSDHKWTFTILKQKSWSQKSINIFDLLSYLGDEAEVLKVELINSNYRYALPLYDQTLTAIGESSIEFIIRKRTIKEVEMHGLRQNKQVIDKS